MKEIEREHPEYVRRKAMLKRYRDLYAGGEQLRGSAAEYLIPRHKEPWAVYNERLRGFFTKTTSVRSWTGTPRRCSGGSRF